MNIPEPPQLRLRAQDLAGKHAVITGATRGIGRATALHLASRGCSVLATCSSPDSLHHIATMNQTLVGIYANSAHSCPAITGLVADIYSPHCATEIADAVANPSNSSPSPGFAGQLDILILNAAAPWTTDVGALEADEVAKSLLGNVQTTVLIVDELVKRKMFRPESRIVFISSIRGRMPSKRQIMYAAGKAAGESMCKTWAECFGGKHEEFAFMAGTTANAVVVGLTATDAVVNIPADILPGILEEFVPKQDIPKTAIAEDVADAIGMLCGNDARWITGQSISVSGGIVKLH